MTVDLEVTVPQALALKAMFDYWNQLSGRGSSRFVGFYVDGDGDFHPKVECTFDKILPELTDRIREISVQKDEEGDRMYDYDGIACHLDSLVQDAVIIIEAMDEFQRQNLEGKMQIAKIIVNEIERRKGIKE